MARLLVTEQTVREVLAKGKKRLEIPKGSIITLLASEVASTAGVEIVEIDRSSPSREVKEKIQNESGGSPSNSDRVVVFGSDHGGFQLKETLKKHAEGLGFKTLDVGTFNEEPCDYPDFAYAVAKTVALGQAFRGVMIDGAGIGSCVVANKVPGVKAACCHNEFVARNAREHNDTNVLTLGSRVTGTEVCKEILKVWLEAWFSGGRHKLRVEKIHEVEKRYLKP